MIKPKRRPKTEQSEEEVSIKRHTPPGRTVESREQKIIRKVYDLVEKRVDRGTATSQETSHFLKLGSTLGRLEIAKLERENQLLVAKTQALESQKRVEELFEEAMKAFGIYRGEKPKDDPEE